jgi:hypothetical protein
MVHFRPLAFTASSTGPGYAVPYYGCPFNPCLFGHFHQFRCTLQRTEIVTANRDKVDTGYSLKCIGNRFWVGKGRR